MTSVFVTRGQQAVFSTLLCSLLLLMLQETASFPVIAPPALRRPVSPPSRWGVGQRRGATNVEDEGGDLVSVRRPSNEEGKTMLEWPSIQKRGTSDERYDGGETLYCLEGTVDCRVSTFLNGKVEETVALAPGSLLSVENPCAISWVVPEGKSVVLLTPTYTEGTVFIGVLAGVVVSFGVLIAVALGG